MKIQFLLVSVLCVVVKGQHYAYHQAPQDHVPLIKDGVPIDTPEVQAAKAAHFEAYEKARALAARHPSNGQYEQQVIPQYQQQYQQQPQYQQVDFQHQQYQPQSYQQQNQYQSNVVYSQPKQQYAVGAYSSALPIDTPEVQQARTAHLAALSQAQTHHYRARRNVYHEGHYVPQETPEVQYARYQHLVAHAHVHDEDDDDYYPAPHDDHFHIPIITKKGVPVNTASVKAARQQHQLAHRLVKSGVHQISGGHSVHEPVIAPNGVPFDTPDVYVAKIHHLIAHAEESTKHNQWGLHSGYGGNHGF